MDFILCKHMWLILIVSTATVVTSAEPKPTHKSHVINRQMSGEKHFVDEEHNAEYDHDAFVGHEDAEEYDELPPDESKRRLGLLYAKIDANGDNQVSTDELASWMRNVQVKTMAKETDTAWNKIEPKSPDHATWDEYVLNTYGEEDEDVEEQDQEDMEYEAREKAHDERRWKLADTNNDGVLSRKEFNDFVHPEDVPHMKESVVQDVLDDLDKDHDGFISLREYLADIEGTETDDESDDEPRHWTPEDEEEFRTAHDKNGDGKLDLQEVYQWIVPKDFDHIEEETSHLFEEADANKDGFLSSEEMVDRYDVFVGSQATNYGSFFEHEEL